MSDPRRHSLTDGKSAVFLAEHAKERISEHFRVKDIEQIRDVLTRAIENGLLFRNGDDSLIEHGCLLIAGKIIETVYDLSRGISRGLKERTRNARPTPWEDCEVKMPGEESEELYLPPSSGSSAFSKTESLEAFLSLQENSRAEV